jgi:Tol biopolymer transport system component
VYLIGADGRGETRLTRGPEDESNGPSTPDGKHLVIASASRSPQGEAEGFHLLRLPIAAAPASPLSPMRERGLRLLPAARGLVRELGLLPDGKRLVFESVPDGTAPSLREIFVTSLTPEKSGRPSLRALTDNREGNFDPTVCGRTDYIAFTSSRDQQSELYRMRADGSDVRRLTYSRGSKWQPRCSPDGGRIFFVSDRDGADRIYSVLRNGSEPKRLTALGLDPARSEDSPTVSPDGRAIAYLLRGPGPSARLRVIELGSAAGAGQDCEVPTPPGSQASDPEWSPRRVGRLPALAFTLQPLDRGGKPAPGERQIFLSDARCGPVAQVTSARGPNFHPLWLP